MWPSIQNPPHVTTLTHHYYFGGPATNPNVNIPNLLKPATMERVQKMADTATAAADKMGVRVRMTEGNTCYRGGKPGVSDVFAAALWSADYSLLLASNNYSGVNLHGGTGKSVANSVGGFLPGDVMLKDGGRHAGTNRHPSASVLYADCDVRRQVHAGAGGLRAEVCRRAVRGHAGEGRPDQPDPGHGGGCDSICGEVAGWGNEPS